MEKSVVFEAVKGTQKGVFTRVGWESRIESAAARKQGFAVRKVSEATVRIGISYSNIKSVKLARENSDGTTRTIKLWFKHLEDLPSIIEHLNDSSKVYLQVFTVNKNSHPKVKYYINGEEATKSEVVSSGLCNASTFSEHETPVVFNIPIENLLFVGNYR